MQWLNDVDFFFLSTPTSSSCSFFLLLSLSFSPSLFVGSISYFFRHQRSLTLEELSSYPILMKNWYACMLIKERGWLQKCSRKYIQELTKHTVIMYACLQSLGTCIYTLHSSKISIQYLHVSTCIQPSYTHNVVVIFVHQQVCMHTLVAALEYNKGVDMYTQL